MTHHVESLRRIGACRDAIAWAATQPDAETAWRECHRSDWMLWAISRSVDPDHRALVRVAAECVRSVLHLVPSGEDRPRLAIEAAEAWADDPTEERRAAASAAADAASSASYAASASYATAFYAAAYAASYAADAADAAASYAATAAAAAAYAAASYAAAAAVAAVARSAQADIVRRHFPSPPRFAEAAP